jgi:MtaA/CmuA family methyltransferase
VTQKERLIKALRKEPTDRKPFICPGGMMTMIVTDVMGPSENSWPKAHSSAQGMAALTLAAHTLSGFENLGVPFCMTVEAEGMGAEVDLGTRESEPKVLNYAINTMEEIDRLAALDVSKGRAKVCVDAIRILKERVPHLPVIANVTGPISLATSLVDPLVYYRALIKDKKPAHRLTEIAAQNAVVFGEAMLQAGADVVCIADPSATGEIIGRKAFEEFVVPYVNKMIDRFRTRFDVPSIVHICGNVKTLGGALSAIEADAISIDSLVSIPLLKTMIGEKVAMGNVSTHLLASGTPEAVLRAASACLASGADILAPACGISPKTPVRNVQNLLRAVLDA